MKSYIRKIVSVILTLLFCVAIIIGAGVALSVRNVNIEYISYSSRGDEEREESAVRLNGLKGENLLFLSDEDIRACVGGETVSLESYSKVYPCTLNIVLKERVEQYARANSSGGYDMYAADGTEMGSRLENINPADGSPNVILVADDDRLDGVVSVCGYFRQSFGTIRNLVESVTVGYDAILQTSSLTFDMYSGLTVVINDYERYAEQKIAAVFDQYTTLSESRKLRGAICADTLADDVSGGYAAYYIPDWGN